MMMMMMMTEYNEHFAQMLVLTARTHTYVYM